MACIETVGFRNGYSLSIVVEKAPSRTSGITLINFVNHFICDRLRHIVDCLINFTSLHYRRRVDRASIEFQGFKDSLTPTGDYGSPASPVGYQLSYFVGVVDCLTTSQ